MSNMEVSNTDSFHSVSVFHGRTENAEYQEQLVKRYQGNPAIEALPKILSEEEAVRSLAHYPERDINGHKHPSEIRMHLIMDVLHIFDPLPVHIDLEQRVSRLIREGYVGRNPVERDEWKQLDQVVENICKANDIPMRSSGINGFGIIGLPGMGKTTTTERILQLYPQVIFHQTYKGNAFPRVQLVWLKLTCPYDGSIKGLCLDFFREIDGLLGTHYYRDYAGKGRRTVDELIPAMARVAWIHCLGVLVIDEIQHLSQAKSGGAERMLNFFLQLMNTLGLPVIMIGTYGALNILSRELRQIRRSSGQGDFIWDAMPNEEAWLLFAESLFRYQYTRHQVTLTQELADVLHEESAGIIDFAVKLFLLAQTRAIATGVERITPAIIRSVAKDSLKMAQPALRAIRSGDTLAVATMTDLHPIDFQSAAQRVRKDSLLQNLSKGTRLASDRNSAAGDNRSGSGSFDHEDESAVSHESPPGRKPKAKRKSASKNQNASACHLVQVADAGAEENGLSAHESLTQSEVIKPLFNNQP